MHTWCNNTCAFSDAFTNEIKHTKQTKKKMRDIVYFVRARPGEEFYAAEKQLFYCVNLESLSLLLR